MLSSGEDSREIQIDRSQNQQTEQAVNVFYVESGHLSYNLNRTEDSV